MHKVDKKQQDLMMAGADSSVGQNRRDQERLMKLKQKRVISEITATKGSDETIGRQDTTVDTSTSMMRSADTSREGAGSSLED
jgi:hypothetical protein